MARPGTLIVSLLLCVVSAAVVLTVVWESLGPAAAPVPAGTGPGLRQADAGGLERTTRAAAKDARRPLSDTAGVAPSAADEARLALRGVVLGPDDMPVAAAAITVLRRAGDGYNLLDGAHNARKVRVADAVTDVRGQFAVRLLPGRAYLVAVDASGYPRTWAVDCYPGTDVTLRLQRPAILVGRVTAGDGNPIAGVVVRGGRDDPQAVAGPGELFRGKTDADGCYRFESLWPGPTWLRFHPLRHSSPRRIQLILPVGATTRHDITLLPGQTIRGRVVDAVTKWPIAGARVGESVLKSTRTDADGQYVLEGFSQEHVEIEVAAKGYGKIERRIRNRFGQAVPATQDFELQPGRRAQGRVVDVAGVGLAGAYVAGVATDFGDPKRNLRAQRVDWRTTSAATDGSFVIDGLRTDMPHVLFVKKDGFASVVYDFPAQEMDGPVVELGTITLDPAATIVGVVVDENGNGLSGLKVELDGWNHDRRRMSGHDEPRDGEWLINSYIAARKTRTDGAGRFRFTDLPAGTFTAKTKLSGRHKFSKQENIVVPRGQLVGDVRISVRVGRTIAGRIELADGGKLPKVYISIDPTDGAQSSGDVEVKSDGTFSLSGLEPGAYRLTAYPYVSREEKAKGRNLRTTVVDGVPAGRKDVVIRLQPGK